MRIYPIFRPLIFKLDPETAHNLAIFFLKAFPNFANLFCFSRNYSNLKQTIWNIDFANPIGLAAGFDKNAEAMATLQKFGFGFLEIGTVTPKAQSGNDKPRIFRLEKDLALINRLGFNNFGAEIFGKNLEQNLSKISLPIGINIGKNKDSVNPYADYLELLSDFYTRASYITINISSPNTKNLRDLQKEDQLNQLLGQIMERKNELKNRCKKNVPILVKVAPDLTLDEQEKIAHAALNHKIDGLIISNTTIDRDLNLRSENSSQSGGLSGAPLFDKSNEALKNFYRLTNKQIPLIGVGGISCARDAYEKIKLGASLVQIYSAFIFEGFGLVEKIKKDLSQMVEKDGFQNISQAIGLDN